MHQYDIIIILLSISLIPFGPVLSCVSRKLGDIGICIQAVAFGLLCIYIVAINTNFNIDIIVPR